MYVDAGLLLGSNKSPHLKSQSWTFCLNHLVNIYQLFWKLLLILVQIIEWTFYHFLEKLNKGV